MLDKCLFKISEQYLRSLSMLQGLHTEELIVSETARDFALRLWQRFGYRHQVLLACTAIELKANPIFGHIQLLRNQIGTVHEEQGKLECREKRLIALVVDITS